MFSDRLNIKRRFPYVVLIKNSEASFINARVLAKACVGGRAEMNEDRSSINIKEGGCCMSCTDAKK